MATGKALDGKPYAGNPHVRFDEGEVAPAATPRRGSLLYKAISLTFVAVTGLAVFAAKSEIKQNRQWGVAPDGSVWTGNAKRFIYAPTLRFPKVQGAAAYKSEVIDDLHGVYAIDSETSVVSLESAWKDIPVGYVTVICRAVGGDGKCIGEAGRRTLWKKSSFEPSRLEKRAMPYALARTRIFENFLGMEQTKKLAVTGELDLDSYPLNGYPSKMLAAEIIALCEFAMSGTMGENDSAAQLDLARKAGDFLISYSVPAGLPLECMPRTYHERGSEYGRFKGEQDRIHLVYPAKAGIALVALYRATGDGKYLKAATRIARTYIRLQGSDGTWPMMMDAQTGKPCGDNRLMPLEAMLFMESLHEATGDKAFRDCADRAFAFMENGPMNNWNWEGQFEDCAKKEFATHRNLSNFPANMMASYLVKRFPKDEVRIAQAEELCRFVEDQFIDWTPPYDNGRSVEERGGDDDGTWKWFCRPTSKWCVPCVEEQYFCYVPVNASAAKTINALLDVWEATGKPIYLEKAKALGDAQTRMVEPDGFINTWSVKGVRRSDHRYHTWINCTMETMSALGRLAEAEKGQRRKEGWK